MKPFRTLAAFALVAATSVASAHATLVFGELTLTPDPPTPAAETRWRITLADPSLAGVEDAIVFLDLRPLAAEPGAGDAEGGDGEVASLLVERLVETAPATYEVSTPPPPPGSYLLLIRDQTFSWEEATASLVLTVGAESVGMLPFILPPTSGAPRSLTSWLVWLIGVPVAAGAIVTLLVLRGAKAPERIG